VPERDAVLFWRSSPRGTRALALDEEHRKLQGALRDANRLEIVDVPAARPIDLLAMLSKRTASVLHFSGHGETGELSFQVDDGTLRPVSTAELTEVVRLAGGTVRLVVLNACHTESHAAALLAHVDCVVATRGRIDDVDAARFAVAFYRQLADGDSVRIAFDTALLAVQLQRTKSVVGVAARDIVAELGPDTGTVEEPLRLFERDPGCASERFMVRRRN